MQKETSKSMKAIVAVLALMFGAFLILLVSGWIILRSQLVAAGLASPKFPYLRYSQEELAEIFVDYTQINIPTTQTPEQTHAIFIEHLKNKEIDEAVECCFQKGKWDEMKKFIRGVEEKGMLELMTSDLSEITQDLMFDYQATYVYSGTKNGEKVGRFMRFIKETSSGKWLIKDF